MVNGGWTGGCVHYEAPHDTTIAEGPERVWVIFIYLVERIFLFHLLVMVFRDVGLICVVLGNTHNRK